MNKQTQIESFNRLVEKQREIMLSKGDDYANEDRLSNFKTAGQICGLTAAQHCLAMIATKVARLGVLLNPNSPAPKHEAVEDSVLDLANYAQLLNMILDEEPVSEPEESKNCCGKWDENGLCSCKITESKYDLQAPLFFRVKDTAGALYEYSKDRKFDLFSAKETCRVLYGNSYSENFNKIFTMIQ
jgi:hypothetical protein